MRKILDFGKQTALQNMATDTYLLSQLPVIGAPILHLYDWTGDSATYGHFIEPDQFLKMDGVHKKRLQLAKRPTGGGIVFHLCDFAFSILIPYTHPSFSMNTLVNYEFINSLVAKVIKKFGANTHLPEISTSLLQKEMDTKNVSDHSKKFCMALPTKYDVIIDNKKVGGAAQRKTKFGYLHQGTISLGLLSQDFLNDLLSVEHKVLEAMQQNSFSLLGNNWTSSELIEGKALLKNLLTQEFNQI